MQTLTCPLCRRQRPNTAAEGEHFTHLCDDCRANPPAELERETVKQIDIFGRVHDTYATEAELNGWRPTQGTML